MLRSIKSLLRNTIPGKMYVQHRMRRDFWKWSERDETASRFYQQFVRPGDIVFDVGANRGNRAKVFLKLKAFTVLVEPQIPCGDYLKIVLHGVPNWTLVEKALGSEEGELEMLISPQDVISTLSPHWLETVQKSGRFAGEIWDKRQKTPVTTLDQLIRQQGMPSFIKIDVEGYETKVLAGLSSAPQALSFEFVPECLDDAFACMDHLLSLASYEFQLSLGESMTLGLDKWLSGSDLKGYLRHAHALTNAECFGDIYARKSKRIT